MPDHQYEIEIKEEAQAEILEAYQYYESSLPKLGDRFLNQLEKYLDLIKVHPYLFESKHPPYRDAFIQKFPYLIIYEVTESTIIVYSVFHTHRNPETKYQK